MNEIITKIIVEKGWRNVQENVKRIALRIAPAPAHDRRCILICYGPSLNETWQMIEQSKGDVVTVSAAHEYMATRGIIPKYHVDSDPRPHKAKHIRRPQHSTKYRLASCVHPDVLNRLRGYDVALWHALNGDETDTRIEDLEPDAWGVAGGSNVGLRAIVLMYMLGYRDFEVHGMDCSFQGDGAVQWAGRHAGRTKALLPFQCRGFHTSALMIDYAREFFQTRARMPDATFNLRGRGLLQVMVKEQSNLKENAA